MSGRYIVTIETRRLRNKGVVLEIPVEAVSPAQALKKVNILVAKGQVKTHGNSTCKKTVRLADG